MPIRFINQQHSPIKEAIRILLNYSVRNRNIAQILTSVTEIVGADPTFVQLNHTVVAMYKQQRIEGAKPGHITVLINIDTQEITISLDVYGRECTLSCNRVFSSTVYVKARNIHFEQIEKLEMMLYQPSLFLVRLLTQGNITIDNCYSGMIESPDSWYEENSKDYNKRREQFRKMLIAQKTQVRGILQKQADKATKILLTYIEKKNPVAGSVCLLLKDKKAHANDSSVVDDKLYFTHNTKVIDKQTRTLCSFSFHVDLSFRNLVLTLYQKEYKIILSTTGLYNREYNIAVYKGNVPCKIPTWLKIKITLYLYTGHCIAPLLLGIKYKEKIE